MPQKILVLEDNRFHMDAICKILDELHRDIVVLRAFDLHTAYQILLENTIHLFILDIVLDTKVPGDNSGMRLAEAIRRNDKYRFTPLIFTTSVEDPKLYSYSRLHCFGYIEKPYSVEQVKETVLSALEFPVMSDDDRYVSFQKDHILYSKRIKDIMYIRINRRQVDICCVDDELELPYKTAKEILKDLDSESFVQCSRYTIVNRTYIEQIDYTNRFIKLRGMDTELEIGAIKKSEFREKMDKWYRK